MAPADTLVELDADEIADFTVDAIFHHSDQVSVGVGNGDLGLERDRQIHLQARAGKRNVFKVGY